MKSKAFSIVSIIIGILVLTTTFSYPLYPTLTLGIVSGFFLGIAAIVLGILGIKKNKSKLGIIGIVLGIVTLILAILSYGGFFYILSFILALIEYPFHDIGDCENIQDQYARDLCYTNELIYPFNLSICEKIQGLTEKAECYGYIAYNLQNSTICDGLQDENVTNGCYEVLNYYTSVYKK